MKHIWIKRRLRTIWIKNVESFDLTDTLKIGTKDVPAPFRFICKHSDGGVSIVPVPNILDLKWGVINDGDGIHRPNEPIHEPN